MGEIEESMLTSTINGQIVVSKLGGPYLYEDGTSPNEAIRPCPKCNLCPTDKGHDACIADLPGVAFACCGHGVSGLLGRIHSRDVNGVDREFDSVEDMITFHATAASMLDEKE